MKKRNNRWQAWLSGFLFMTLAAVVFTACGTAPTRSTDRTRPGVAADTSATGENSAENETDETNAADTVSADSSLNGLNVDASSVTVDADGIEVGFTAEGRPYRGKASAPVVMEEFSDYQCPFCGRFASQTLPSLEANQIRNGEVVIVYYDFPLSSIHPQAEAAANAARCAGEQGAAAYWAMHDALFANPQQWSNGNANEVFREYARDLGLELESLVPCLNSNKYANQIQTDLAYGRDRGVTSTPTFFVNDQILVGAQPLETFNDAIVTIQNGGTLANAQPAETTNNQPAVKPTPATISAEGIAFSMGSPDAAVTIVEYTDYQCPFCQRHAQQTLPQIISEMIETGRVRYVIKDFPLDNIHPEAREAAVAARCAGEQAVYWEMHEALFNNQAQWGGRGDDAARQAFADLAQSLGIDSDSFSQCLTSGKYDAQVQADLEEGAGLGVRGTPAFFINGFPVSGAQPFELFVYAVDLAEQGTLADAYEQQPTQQQQAQAPQPPTGPVDIPIDNAYSIGAADAPVVIVEFTDYQCPFCSRHFQQTFPQIKANFIDTGLVRYVFMDFPITSIHPQAFLAAQAARCAGDQGAYAEMHDQLFNMQGQWNNRADAADLFTTYAGQLGLDTESFSQCLSSNKHEEAVRAGLQTGINLGVNGTPAFFINGYFVNGAQPYEVFAQAINTRLAETVK